MLIYRHKDRFVIQVGVYFLLLISQGMKENRVPGVALVESV